MYKGGDPVVLELTPELLVFCARKKPLNSRPKVWQESSQPPSVPRKPEKAP